MKAKKTQRAQEPPVTRFVARHRRRGARVHAGWWFAIAEYKDGRRFEIVVDEKRNK
jgi:hypothetical protein